ncbi:hypothetical protein KRX57_08645 [Weeksellaceae bacterium TAE3-ERU29]|nr:hypothetical protein [Weeksellaceae bacterium TAE3-ERU29]
MKEIYKYSDIPYEYFLQKENIIFKKENHVMNKDKILFTLDFPFIVKKVDDDCMYIMSRSKLGKIDFEGKAVETFSFSIMGKKQIKYIDEKLFLLREEIENDWVLSKGYFKEGITWSIPMEEDLGISIIKDRFIILKSEDRVFLCDDKMNKLWQHNFLDLLKGEEIKQHGEIIVHKGILYIYLADKRNNKNTATIAIDAETGEIKNKYKGFAGKLFLYKDKLYTAGYYKVQILDIETEQISEIDFTDILKPKDLQIHWNNFIVEDDYIYFIDGHWATTNKMGILDLKNRKLAWETSIEINDGINNNIREIKISGNRLYAHCSDKSLHIFEKEEEIT